MNEKEAVDEGFRASIRDSVLVVASASLFPAERSGDIGQGRARSFSLLGVSARGARAGSSSGARGNYFGFDPEIVNFLHI